MPEGDTIFRSARALDQALAGRELVRFEARRLIFGPFAPATRVSGTEARGKHGLVHFDDNGRADRHCRRCATTIRWAKQGEANRGTYWCPTCRPRGAIPRGAGIAGTGPG